MNTASSGNKAIEFYQAAFGARLLWHLDGGTHATAGPHPIARMLQGAVVDPFGHMWLVGKILELLSLELRAVQILHLWKTVPPFRVEDVTRSNIPVSRSSQTSHARRGATQGEER